MTRFPRLYRPSLALGAIGLMALAACGSSSSSSTASGGSASSASAGKIALLLPETKTARYEAADKPDFLAKLTALGYDTSQVIYANANQDAQAQISQADAAITNGAKVLVLDPVDSAAAGAIADKAKAAGIPVIAYDRLIKNSSGVGYYISFDNVKVGQLQAQSLVALAQQKGVSHATIVMINGSPTDNNAGLFKQGAHSVFDPLVSAGLLTIAKEYDTPDWSPNQAQVEMTQALTALSNKVSAVYSANDGMASGIIAALKSAQVTPLPPVTGQDAELAGIQRIVSGEQYMTIYKAIKPEAEAAAVTAFALASGKTPDATLYVAKTNNGVTDVPSLLLVPVPVTVATIKTTVVADGFYTVAQICTPAYAAACTAAGLS
ncbi:MAG TPA: substrate-binding domain-containing protein [Candidatus Dormibacteraeota bacterium]